MTSADALRSLHKDSLLSGSIGACTKAIVNAQCTAQRISTLLRSREFQEIRYVAVAGSLRFTVVLNTPSDYRQHEFLLYTKFLLQHASWRHSLSVYGSVQGIHICLRSGAPCTALWTPAIHVLPNNRVHRDHKVMGHIGSYCSPSWHLRLPHYQYLSGGVMNNNNTNIKNGSLHQARADWFSINSSFLLPSSLQSLRGRYVLFTFEPDV